MDDWLRANGDYKRNDVIISSCIKYVKKHIGVDLGLVTRISVDEALQCGYQVQCSVKGNAHWVKPIAVSMETPTSPVRYRMYDPMFSVHGYKYVDEYNNPMYNNTRCLYLKEPKKVTASGTIGWSSFIAYVIPSINMTAISHTGEVLQAMTQRYYDKLYMSIDLI